MQAMLVILANLAEALLSENEQRRLVNDDQCTRKPDTMGKYM